jgi:hypothetical protein
MSRTSFMSTRVQAGIGLVVVFAVGVGLSACGGSSSSTTTSTTDSVSGSVLSAASAQRLGFPKTVQAAKKTAVTDQKNCTSSVEAVYEDTATKTGLISDVLNCSSSASAAAALAVAKTHATLDSAVTVPKELGSTAFATDSDAPEYLMVWQAGNRVAITAFDANVAATATSTSTTTPVPMTEAQGKTLGAAAVEQNSLYQ